MIVSRTTSAARITPPNSTIRRGVAGQDPREIWIAARLVTRLKQAKWEEESEDGQSPPKEHQSWRGEVQDQLSAGW